MRIKKNQIYNNKQPRTQLHQQSSRAEEKTTKKGLNTDRDLQSKMFRFIQYKGAPKHHYNVCVHTTLPPTRKRHHYKHHTKLLSAPAKIHHTPNTHFLPPKLSLHLHYSPSLNIAPGNALALLEHRSEQHTSAAQPATTHQPQEKKHKG